VTTSRLPEFDEEWRARRRSKLLGHSCRSMSVGAFSAWAVTIDHVVTGTSMSAGRWVLVFALGAVAWFLLGSGSGFLWTYLAPRPPSSSV
jgi:hypothetical protein